MKNHHMYNMLESNQYCIQGFGGTILRKIIEVLNSNWGLLLAFVPGVNVLYLVFRLLVATNGSSKISVWAIFPALLISCLYLIVPASWHWLVTHVIISVIVFIIMRKSQGSYCCKLRTTIPVPAMICVVAFVLLLVNSIANDSTDQLSGQAFPYIHQGMNAIIAEDAAEWSAAVHPTEGTNIANFDYILAELKRNHITLTEDFKFGRRSSIHTVDVEGDGEAIKIERHIIDGSNYYRLVVVCLFNEDGGGMITFDIMKT